MRLLSAVSNSQRARRAYHFLTTQTIRLAHYGQVRAVEYGDEARILTYYAINHPKEAQHDLRQWLWQVLFCLSTAVIVIWLFVLQWGETTVFDKSIRQCHWDSWERWPTAATPHHLVFIADPQLIDPHTYPGRPWPLSTFTVKHTDNYLRRSYSRLQQYLDPDTIFFLGDLFDGGREWSTGTTQSLDPQWRKKKYGKQLWLKEYERFSRIFFRDWVDGHPTSVDGHSDRTIIASLPGNHDLGFGRGIQLASRDRFQAFFGDSNRIDFIANHTFISIDSVSLSAKDDEAAQEARDIWGPVDEFLDNALANKSIQLKRLFNPDQPLPKPNPQDHVVEDAEKATNKDLFTSENYTATADFPTILLTHVPLFRNPGTPCGPLRERYPPTPPPPGQNSPVEPDERNALAIARGYQYQNVISKPLTSLIIDKLGGTVEYAFSGDDHDYCEVVHRAYSSPGAGIREITVKSISWAMGVRKPGFLMVSLWNPVDREGKKIKESEQDKTLQTHLCLLPDQLSILIRYGLLFGFSAFALFIRAFLVVFVPSKFGGRPQALEEPPLLPSFAVIGPTPVDEKSDQSFRQYSGTDPVSASSSTSSAEDTTTHRSGRNGVPRPRSSSPRPAYGYGINTERVPSPSPDRGQTVSARRKPPLSVTKEKDDSHKHTLRVSTQRARRKMSKAELLIREWIRSLARTGWVVLLYFWWIWSS